MPLNIEIDKNIFPKRIWLRTENGSQPVPDLWFDDESVISNLEMGYIRDDIAVGNANIVAIGQHETLWQCAGCETHGIVPNGSSHVPGWTWADYKWYCPICI